MKGQLTNQCSEILKLKFVSLLDFGNFKHYSEKFPSTTCESLLKSNEQHFDSLLAKIEYMHTCIYTYIYTHTDIHDFIFKWNSSSINK
jgi:hypothetical protein